MKPKCLLIFFAVFSQSSTVVLTIDLNQKTSEISSVPFAPKKWYNYVSAKINSGEGACFVGNSGVFFEI